VNADKVNVKEVPMHYRKYSFGVPIVCLAMLALSQIQGAEVAGIVHKRVRKFHL